LRGLFFATIDGDQITAWNNEIDRVLALFHVCLCNILTLLLNSVSSLR
jgi:hypothetical protein